MRLAVEVAGTGGFAVGPGGAWFLRGVVRAEGCAFARTPAAWLRLVPCVGVEGGAMKAAGILQGALATVGQGVVPWAGAGFLPRAAFDLGPVALEVQGGPVFPAVRHTFSFQMPDYVIYELPAVTWTAGLARGSIFRDQDGGPRGLRGAMSSSETLAPPAEVAGTVSREARAQALVREHFGFVWRSLLRLGVPRADAEDALQQVFIVTSQKLDAVEPGRERTFLFAVALRIASRAHRTRHRRREVPDAEPAEHPDPTPGPDELLDRGRARAALDAILADMPIELRAVFVLYEMEEATIAEIAALLKLPAGTVASRLRRARESFKAAVRRRKARGGQS